MHTKEKISQWRALLALGGMQRRLAVIISVVVEFWNGQKKRFIYVFGLRVYISTLNATQNASSTWLSIFCFCPAVWHDQTKAKKKTWIEYRNEANARKERNSYSNYTQLKRTIYVVFMLDSCTLVFYTRRKKEKQTYKTNLHVRLFPLMTIQSLDKTRELLLAWKRGKYKKNQN